ncbi:DUF934 domain-containing protein [Marinomonas sp. 2405UD68-3]|uniref:DUF934 domain-containing protein n=1 Tax=Marinomonas sp. 2405UD68-3 TaxID=3391835 RepID=UPI0039C923AD
MQKLIKDGAIIENKYTLIQDEDTSIDQNSIIPVDKWLENSSPVAGVWLDSDQNPSLLEGVNLNQFSVIGVNFPAFVDGRGFTYGRLLRERYNFKGELRALGNFIPDQLGYLLRVGFNSFDFPAEVNLDNALKLHKPFDVKYQGDANDPRPLFLRR